MTRFRFELATPDDDAGLREVLRETRMPGTIGLQFLREPSFFQANCVLGEFQQTIICRDLTSGEIVGCGCRSVREMMVDGRSQPVGYLSMLRGKNRFRSMGLMARGYRFLRELHQDGRAKFYLTTIAEGNDEAIKLLTSGRLSLPNYEFEGAYTTFVIPCRNSRFAKRPDDPPADGSVVRPARESDLESIVNFLEAESLGRRYFPRYRREDFLGSAEVFRNLKRDDIWIALDGANNVVGTMALWDQRPFRQTVVRNYQGPLNQFRPFYNVWAQLTGGVRLPKPGDPLNYAFVAIPVVRNRKLFSRMLKCVVRQASSRGLESLLIGCHEQDEQRAMLQRVSPRSYGTRMYRVTWAEDCGHSENVHGNSTASSLSPYLELGCL